MKTLKNYIIIFAVLIGTAGCDQDFIEINTDPFGITEINPALLFAGAQRTPLGGWEGEHTIVQHFVNPFNQGATLGFNFNEDIDNRSSGNWNSAYTNPGHVRLMVQALEILGENTDRVNLKSMIRIWKAQVFIGLVDAYGNIPYSEAGKAVIDQIFYPVYDRDEAIYEDLYREITGALAAFNPTADFVREDLFYGVNSENPAANAAAQVEKWRKLGNSLLLRLGMRYSKVNPSRAQSIVAEAFSGGVMTSNNDNAYVKYDGSLFVQGENNNLRNFSYFFYAAEPFVDQLKSTNDPRAQFILANFKDPAAVVNDQDPDTELANQFGVPIGVISNDLADANGPYRGSRLGGLNYSQMNIWAIASPAAPDFWVTYAQTSLLLAEAAHRGWISGGDARTYYENAIRADMQVYALYPATRPITEEEINEYLNEPGVVFNASRALELINTQYWVVNLRNGGEAWANFRRSGFPALQPNLFNNNLNGGFVRRMSYPDREASANAQSFAAAIAIRPNDLISRVFWDIE